MPLHLRRRRSGFTLIELLIVMGIIALLIGLLLPAVAKVRESAYRAQCTNNLSQLGKAFVGYQTTAGSLPPSTLYFGNGPYTGGFATWAVLILPHIDQDNVFRQWNTSLRYHHRLNDGGRAVAIPMMFCPTRRNTPSTFSQFPADKLSTPSEQHKAGALSDYVVCDGNQFNLPATGDGGGAIVAAVDQTFILGDQNGNPGIAPCPPMNGNAVLTKWKSATKLSSISRGASNTLMIGEKHIRQDYAEGQGPYIDSSVFNGSRQGPNVSAGAWSKMVGSGVGLQKDPLYGTRPGEIGWERMFGSAHLTGVNFAFADGSVRNVPFSTDPVLLDQLARRALGPTERPATPDF